jgi:hypothetical protein
LKNNFLSCASKWSRAASITNFSTTLDQWSHLFSIFRWFIVTSCPAGYAVIMCNLSLREQVAVNNLFSFFLVRFYTALLVAIFRWNWQTNA